MRKKTKKQHRAGRAHMYLLLGTGATLLAAVSYFSIPSVAPITYTVPGAVVESEEKGDISAPPAEVFKPIYLNTPDPLKAIYMTQCVVGTPSFRRDLVELIEQTELNAVVIDVKDYSGKIGFPTNRPELRNSVSDQCGAADMKEFVKSLNEKGIYTIARITVFQDPYYTKAHPELAIKKASATTTVWKDYKGLSFIDAGARAYWDYIVALSEETHAIGFDELNFDYIRFPSDGNMQDIYYPFSEERIVADPYTGKAKVLRDFFAYVSNKLKHKPYHPEEKERHVPILSADLFGMTMTNPDDLNVGQILEYAEPYFDYIAPMVYPSHYPSGFNGWANPNHYPYDIVKFSMDRGVARMLAASSTPSKLRPWLQDFDYGGDYDIEEVRGQMQATYDAGLTSWMLWAPSNRYTRGALQSSE